MTEYSPVSPPPPRDTYEDEISVEEWLRVIRGRWRLFVSAACAGLLVAAVVAYSFPPSRVATTELIVERRSDADPIALVMARHQRGLTSLSMMQQIVDELGLDKAPHRMSAEQLKSQTVVTTADAEGLLTIAVQSGDPELAASVATSLARHGVESARRFEERSRVLGDIDRILRLRLDLPDLLAEIQGEETGLRVIQEILNAASSVSLQYDVAMSRVRLARLRAKWDHIVSAINTAEEVAEKLEDLPPNSELPASLASELKALNDSFGVAVGKRRVVESPLRLRSKTEVSEPRVARQWATNFGFGLVLGLLLALTFSVVLYVLSVGRKPAMARPTAE